MLVSIRFATQPKGFWALTIGKSMLKPMPLMLRRFYDTKDGDYNTRKSAMICSVNSSFFYITPPKAKKLVLSNSRSGGSVSKGRKACNDNKVHNGQMFGTVICPNYSACFTTGNFAVDCSEFSSLIIFPHTVFQDTHR